MFLSCVSRVNLSLCDYDYDPHITRPRPRSHSRLVEVDEEVDTKWYVNNACILPLNYTFTAGSEVNSRHGSPRKVKGTEIDRKLSCSAPSNRKSERWNEQELAAGMRQMQELQCNSTMKCSTSRSLLQLPGIQRQSHMYTL